MGLRAVVSRGDRRKSLEAIRDALASELEIAEGATAATLARELRVVLTELDEMPAAEGESRLDRIAAGVADEVAVRRARRVAGTAGS